MKPMEAGRFRGLSWKSSLVMALKKEKTMKWSRKIMAAVLSVASLMGMTSLSGCGSSNNAQEENPKSIKIWHYEEDNGAMGKAWKKAMDIFEKETGVKVEFEKKSFEQIRQTASQVLNSDDAPDVMEYNKGNATAGLLASQGLLSKPQRLRQAVQVGQEDFWFFGRYRQIQ